MDGQEHNSVLRRKATAAKEVWQARAMSPAKALRLSIARAAEDLWELAVAASGIELSEDRLEALIDAMPDEGMILLLDGPDGVIGAAHLPFPIVAGLIEAQTIGQLAKTTPDARAVTRTDAAMVAPLIDGMMERFDALLDEGGIAPWARGYRFGTMMDSARMLSLALKAAEFHVIRFTLDLAAMREGEAMLMLPKVEHPTGGGIEAAGGGSAAASLEGQVLQAPTELRAVLHRLSMPLSAISSLAVGEVLSIPKEALAKTEIEVGTETVIGTTKLGQMNGMRALRMQLPGQPDAAPAAEPAAPPALDFAAPEPAVPEPAVAEPAMAEMPALEPAPMAMDLSGMDEESDFPDLPAMEPMPAGETDLLGDLPDLGDLPGMGSDTGDVGELPDLGAMPMADLPIIE